MNSLPSGKLPGFLRIAYRLRTSGLDNIPDGPCLIVCNHLSFLDGPLLACCLPRDVLFAVDTQVMRHWLVKLITKLARVVAIAPENPLSLRSLADELRHGGKVLIFPEGRIGRTGIMMKLYDGAAMLWEKSGRPPIVAAHIEGPQRTRFSFLGGRRIFTPVGVRFSKPFAPEIDPALKSKRRRMHITRVLGEQLEAVAYASDDKSLNIPQALLAAAKEHGLRKIVVADNERELDYRLLLQGAFALSSLARRTRADNIGVFLPTSPGGLVALLAIQFAGKAPVMLNFTAGEKALLSSCRTAQVGEIWSSDRFLDAANLRGLQAKLEEGGLRFVLLEKARGELGLTDKVAAALRARWPMLAEAGVAGIAPDSTAAILFTSGSEGDPKGVALSHRNLLCNCRQTLLRLEVRPSDVLLHTLPMFHSFGLFAGLLGLLRGLRTRMHPTPLRPREITEIAYHDNATIFFSANSFLARYAKTAHPYDFRTMRLVVAGAEKLSPETRGIWEDKFGIRLYEGYGVTETSPVIAFNTPLENRPGSVGRAVPGLKAELVPVEGINEGGRLKVQGDNVMKGYLFPDKPGEIVPPADGWHDTGDIAVIDDDGFIRIVGRVKRFAKIAGEMVPLGVVEEALAKLWPEESHFASAVADAGRGEEIVAVTTRQEASRQEAGEHFKRQGLPALWVPRRFVHVEEPPLLPAGKPDYRRIAEIAKQ